MIGDGGKGAGEDRSASKGPVEDGQCGRPCSAPVWQNNMGGHGSDDEGNGWFSQYI